MSARALALGALLVLVAPLALGDAPRAQEPPAPAPAEGAGEGQREDPPAPPAPEPQPSGDATDAPATDGADGTQEPAPGEGSQQPPATDATTAVEDPIPSSVPPPVQPPPPAHPAVAWPLSIDAIGEHLRGIAAAHPNVAALEVLGRSAGGREILALRLGARDAAPGVERPVLLLADHQGPSSAGPEAALELAWQLAQGFERDERVRALLTQATLVVAPALDPDARALPAAGAPARAGVRFERNFPSGWQPETVRPGAGRVSLSQPEALAAARFLTNLHGCGVVLGFAPSAPRGAPYADAELPQSDREVFARLVAALELDGAPSLVPWFELGSPGGGLYDFAYQARGIYPLIVPLPAEEALASGALGEFASQLVARVLRCLTLLPRVEIAQEGLERLASDTWQLDVRIQNVGIVPTSSALARHREPLADVVLRLDGAKLVATAKRPSSGQDYTDASFQVRAPLSGGTLAGGEGRWLRLFLEASSGAEVRVSAVSSWAGSDAIQVALP